MDQPNIVWNTNLNDAQAAGNVTAAVNGVTSSGTTLPVKSFELVDEDGVGHPNWQAGDKFTIINGGTPGAGADDDDTLYTIVSIGFTSGSAGNIVITPTLGQVADDEAVITKFGTDPTGDKTGYKGNQGSVKNHLRLRNLGYI